MGLIGKLRDLQAGGDLLPLAAADRINEFEDIDCRPPEGLKGLKLAGLLK